MMMLHGNWEHPFFAWILFSNLLGLANFYLNFLEGQGPILIFVKYTELDNQAPRDPLLWISCTTLLVFFSLLNVKILWQQKHAESTGFKHSKQ